MTRKLYTLFLLMALAITVNAQSRYAAHSKLATGKWVKIRVKDEGVYQLTNADLKNMGFSNPAKVCLFGYNLPFLPEAKIEELDDDLTEIPLYRKADGTLLFYSCGTTLWSRQDEASTYTHRNNPYSKYIYYFLTETTGTPAAFKKSETATSTGKAQTTYYTHALHEEDAFSFINTGRTFFEAYDYANGSQKTYQLTFDNTTCGDVTIDVQFGASGNNSSNLSVSVDANTLGTMIVPQPGSNAVASISNKSFTLYDQTVSSLNIKLKHTYSAGISGHLDYIRATSEAQLSLSGKDYVVFSPNSDGTKTFELKGATSATSIWDITTATTTHELSGTLSGTTYKATASNAKFTNRYVAVNTSATYPSPQTVGVVAHQDLHALDDINLVIIVPANGNLTE